MAKFYRSEDKTVLLELFGEGSALEKIKGLKQIQQMQQLKNMYLL